MNNVLTKPVKLAPSPANDPVNEPVNCELAPVNWIELAPETTVPLSVKVVSANASPVHFEILFEDKAMNQKLLL
jgi:hypothetical protein